MHRRVSELAEALRAFDKPAQHARHFRRLETHQFHAEAATVCQAQIARVFSSALWRSQDANRSAAAVVNLRPGLISHRRSYHERGSLESLQQLGIRQRHKRDARITGHRFPRKDEPLQSC